MHISFYLIGSWKSNLGTFLSFFSSLIDLKCSILCLQDPLLPRWLDTDQINLYVKDPFESKHQLLINGREKVGIKNFKNLKLFVDFSQTNDVYENLEDINPTNKRRVLIMFDGLIAHMKSNKKFYKNVV